MMFVVAVGIVFVALGFIGLRTGKTSLRINNLIWEASGLLLIFLMIGGQFGVTLLGLLLIAAVAAVAVATNPHMTERLKNPGGVRQAKNVRFAAAIFWLGFAVVMLGGYLLGAWLIYWLA